MSNQVKIEFDQRFQGYVNNWITANYWKVESRFEREDVMQEAAVVFAKLVNMYPNIDNDAWFMGIFKRSFNNRMLDLAKKDSRVRSVMTHVSDMVIQTDDGDSLDILETMVGDLETPALLQHKIEHAPSEVKSVLNLISNLPVEIMDKAMEAGKANGTGGRLSNKFLCSLLGKNPKEVNLIDKVESYILEY